MKTIIALLAILTGSVSFADGLKSVDAVNDIAAQYGVAPAKLLQPADVRLEDAPKKEVAGPSAIVEVAGQNEMFFLYGSRIVYFKGKSPEAVSKAFESTSSMPVPPPVEEIWDRNVSELSPEHFVTTYGFRASQSKFFVTITVNCKGATHHLATSPNDRFVQNKWINCVDKNDPLREWYPAGWQSNRVIALSPQVTAVLVHMMLVIHRHKVGFLTPSKEQMFEMGMKASEDTLDGFVKRLQ